MTTIYLSSTYEDLQDHRRTVFDLLKKSGYEVIAMEDYVATDKRPVEKSLQDVANADIYIGIFAFRYGYRPPADHNNPDDLSITELEFRHAEHLDKPCLIFLANDEKWPGKYFDAVSGDNERGERIKTLRDYLSVERMASFFSQPYELSSLVQAAIANKIEENRTEPAQPEAADIETRVIWDIEEKGSPYPGLMHFTPEYSEVFFGRDKEIREVLDRIPQHPFILISGNSGVGKSSLVDAGILPRLKTRGLPGDKSCLPVRMVPSQGETPIAAMLLAFEKAGLNITPKATASIKTSAEMSQHLQHIITRGMTEDVLVLFIDQMEELFTAHELKGSGEFLSALYDFAETGPLRVIATIRSDYLHHCHANDTMLNVIRGAGHYPLGRVEPWMMHDMIVRPARSAGLSIEDTLAARLIQDTGSEPGNLPYLAFALERLFKKRDNTRLSEQAYEAFGGVSGAITEHVREVESKLRKTYGKRLNELLHQLFQDLVVVEKENLPVRSQTRKSKFSGPLQPVVETLIEARLLSTEGEGENSKVSVAHEKLFESWPTLERWITDNQKELWMRGRLANEAREWAAEKTRHEKDPGKWKAIEPDLLLEGARWRSTRDWVKSSHLPLQGVAANYYKRCGENAQSNKHKFYVVGGFIILFLAVFTVFSYVGVKYTNSVHFTPKVVDTHGEPLENYTLYMGEEREKVSESLAWLRRHFLTPRKEHWFRVTASGYIDSYRHSGSDVTPGENIVRPVTLYRKDELLEPKMKRIPKGEFQMGDSQGEENEQDVRMITFSEAFEMGQYEVTFDEYDLFANVTDRELPDDQGWGRGNRPVINVHWKDASAYAHWLSQQTGKEYRLPTEAEWEYAARAMKDSREKTEYWWGNGIKEKGKVWANCDNEYCGDDWEYTAPVGSFTANPFGLYDTAGNVWEWVQDCYGDSYKGAPSDGSARVSTDCVYRVLRGGSWYDDPRFVRSAGRSRDAPAGRSLNIGFRLARTL